MVHVAYNFILYFKTLLKGKKKYLRYT